MNVCAYIFNPAQVKLWGLDAKTRLAAQLRKINITRIQEELSDLEAEDRVLLIRGDYLYEDRILEELTKNSDFASILAVQKGSVLFPVAAYVSGDMLSKAWDLLLGKTGMEVLPDARVITPEDHFFRNFQKKLRKSEAPYVLPIEPGQKKFLEDVLYSASYKGITDLVTKWVWPSLAKQAVRFCAHYNIRPNQVTFLSLLLAVIVTVLFYQGFFVSGLILAWFMTFLDTVDGKLARVTLSSSKVGDVLDHGLDLIHPPVWYIAWGMGTGGPGWEFVLLVIVLGYLGGRLAELIFELRIERSGIFCWRPFDSCFRLVTARRNPNLIILTLAIIMGQAYLGLIGVAIWTVFTTLVLLLRVYKAFECKKEYGFVTPWLAEIEKFQEHNPVAVKLFSKS